LENPYTAKKKGTIARLSLLGKEEKGKRVGRNAYTNPLPTRTDNPPTLGEEFTIATQSREEKKKENEAIPWVKEPLAVGRVTTLECGPGVLLE